MVSGIVKVTNRAGLHTRPAAALVRIAAKYQSDVFICRDGFEINAKSIIGLMTLTAEQGAELELRAEGSDEEEAFKELSDFFSDGFGEI